MPLMKMVACNRCYDEGHSVVATEVLRVKVLTNGTKHEDVGLCSKHLAEVMGVLFPDAKPKRRSPTKVKKKQCPECGFVAKSPQGLGAHRRYEHGKKGVSRRKAG